MGLLHGKMTDKCFAVNVGIDYNSRGRLYDKLVKMAVARGLLKNVYRNGEGLVEASGT